MPRVAPYAFEDLEKKPEAACAEPPQKDLAAVANAYEEGVVEGRRLASQTVAAAQAETLCSIAAAIAEINDMRARIEAERASVLHAVGAFLERYLEGVLSLREIEAITAMLSDLTFSDDDAAPLTASVRPGAAALIRAALESQDSTPAIDIREDATLAPGACAITWRDGEARIVREDFIDAAEAMLSRLATALEQTEAEGQG